MQQFDLIQPKTIYLREFNISYVSYGHIFLYTSYGPRLRTESGVIVCNCISIYVENMITLYKRS